MAASRKAAAKSADAPQVSDARQQARDEAHAQLDEQLDRQDALASVPQKVTDANEHAALLSLTGQKPERDLSDAPPPGLLGPHSETVNPVADPADVDTDTAGTEDNAA